jgi:surface-adhesin protein E
MRAPFIAFLSVAILPVVCSGQAPTGARWTPLLVTAGETVDIDLTAPERTNGTVVAWLRWDLDRNGPEVAGEYHIEHVELDCARARIRVLEASRVPRTGAGKRISLLLDTTPGMRLSPLLESSDTTWHTYSRGSLGAQAVREACRRLTSA